MGEQERREAEAGGEAAAAAHSSSMQRVKVYRLSDGGKWDDQGTGHVTIDYIEGSKELGLTVLDEENNETLLIHNITSEDIYRKQEETIISWRDPEAATELALSFQEAAGCSYTWDNICDIQRNLQFCNLGALEVGPRPVSETLEASRVLHSNATMPHKKTVTRSSAPSSSTGKELIVDEYMEDVEEGDEEEAEASDNNNNSDSSDNNDEESIADDEDENEEEAPDQSQFIGLNVASLKSEKYTILRHINQFRFPRSATLNMFHTKFQQDVYQIIYAKKKFANHRFMKWSYIGKNPIYNGLTRLFRAVRLESLVSLKCNFHAKAIRQFYATVFVSPEHDYLVWMTGQQILEASKDDFISALSLGDSGGVKIHLEEPLDLTQVDEFYDQGNLFVRGRVSGLLPLPSIINRVMRASFFPRSGNNDEIHGRVWNVIKYIKDGTRIDVMDLMIREIATSKGDKNKSIYFAPYIMKLIQSKIDFDNDCDMEHKEYRPRDAPPQVPPPPPPPPQVPPPPPLQPQGQGSASQGLPGQQAHQEQDPVLTALLRLQSSVDRMDAKYDQMYAGLNVRFDRLDSKVTHMDEMLTEYQQQRVPLAYQRFGRRPSPASQHDDPPSTSDAAPPPSTEAPPS